MKRNVGNYDRLIRAIIGLTLIGLTLANIIGLWGWVGVVPLLTAVLGWCPLYMPIGINTYDKSQCSLKRCKANK